MGIPGLAQACNCSNQQASTILCQFKQQFPNIERFHQKVNSFCQENGYVTTITSRKRFIPEMQTNVPEGKRKALNSVIQGSASDLVKQAMIASDMACRSHTPPLRSKLIFQWHDELIFECPDSGTFSLSTSFSV